jgi:hypothetical protein
MLLEQLRSWRSLLGGANELFKHLKRNYILYWLKHHATSRKVAGSSPDEVIGFSNWRNPSSRTMALGSTQPLREMSTRNLPESKEQQALKTWQPHNPMGLHSLLQG